MTKSLKKSLALFLSVMILLSAATVTTAFAETSGDYEYTVSNAGATVTRYNGMGGAVTIPSKLGGYTVKSIGTAAFEQCNSLTSVTIPVSVTNIGNCAFRACGSLTSVTIPDSVKTIGSGAFSDCYKLTSVNIPNGVTTIGDSTFSCCSIKNITIPDSVTTIGNSAFMYCDWLRIVIPRSVTSIDKNAFYGALNVYIISYPESYALNYAANNGFNYDIICDHKDSAVYYKAVPATCTKPGKTAGTECDICGAVIDGLKTVPATGHKYNNKVTPATPSANGSIVPTCKTCGAKNTATVIYSPKTVETAKASFTYTGKELKPTIIVKDSKGNIISADNYTVSYKNNKNVGKATITVTFKGNYSGTLTATFKIVPKGTSLSKLEAKTKSFKATWKKQTKQVTGYELQYSTSKKFTKKTTKTVKIKDAKTVTATVSKLKAGTKYYVRIRTYKTVGKTTYNSSWSKVKNVKTK